MNAGFLSLYIRMLLTASGLLPAGTAIRGLADTNGAGVEIRYLVRRRDRFSVQRDSDRCHPILPAWEDGGFQALNASRELPTCATTHHCVIGAKRFVSNVEAISRIY